ncbi:MAG: ABC transporter permease [Acidobacteriota bacterium]|nr:ABC transporter permease [Acidobacteriota bacterium]
MTLLLSAWTIGAILGLLGLGVYVSYRIFRFADITTDGSVTLGAAVAATLIVRNVHPALATLAAVGAGMLAGTTTGLLHTRFRINQLLSGILVMTALYSINLHVMGKSNIPLLSAHTLTSSAEQAGVRLLGRDTVDLLGWQVPTRDLASLVFSLGVVALVGLGLYLFLRTDLGAAMRATGDNDRMIRALGVDVGNMTVLGLAVANGLVALSGALLAQYQGFADVQMGIGMVVWGLASVIIGQALTGSDSLGLAIAGTAIGSVLFRLMIAIALRWGLDPNDLKLVTAVFVFVALVAPGLARRLRPGLRKKTARSTHA